MSIAATEKHPARWQASGGRATLRTAVLALLLAAACGEGPTPPPDDLLIAGVLIADRAGNVHAHSHADHWHGALEVPSAGELDLVVYMLSRTSGTEVPPSQDAWFTLQDEPDYSLEVSFNPAGVADWQGGRYEARLFGRSAATTLARLRVQHRARADVVYEAPSLVVQVHD